jgi:ligand-binding SRPBCC domain-containing protein
MSKVYSLNTIQKMPVDLETAWNFFSRADNLKDITPAALGFKIISNTHDESMYAGQIIEYKVKPILGISLYWMTEITQVQQKKYFVDEQRYGPYSLWHHQHHFKQIIGGIEMTDIVHYKIPFGFLGNLANTLFVKTELKKIFNYRFKIIEERFGKWAGQANKIKFNSLA